MNRLILMIAALIVTLLACGEKNQTTAPAPETTSVEDSTGLTNQYFPVFAFIKNEVSYVDSMPMGIMKYTSSGSHKDSGYIQLEEFHLLAQEFLPSEINDSMFAHEFRETSFLDQSTNTATFYYKAKNEDLPVSRVDVVTAKGDIYDEVKSIYIEKNYRQQDSFLTKKLFWKPKRNFQIITMTSKDAGKTKNQLIKVVWDNRE